MTTESINNLEKSVESANANLSSVVNVLNQVEKSLNNSTTNEINEFSVMELLESMTEVKNEYHNLRKDLQEVQQLQKEMSNSLRYQMKVMQQTCNILKKRIQLNVDQLPQPPN